MERHILVVEDDPYFSEVIGDVLRAAGYEVTASASGFGVAGLVRRLNPCAVLLDLGLPYRPGTSVLADLKADPRTASARRSALKDSVMPERTRTGTFAVRGSAFKSARTDVPGR